MEIFSTCFAESLVPQSSLFFYTRVIIIIFHTGTVASIEQIISLAFVLSTLSQSRYALVILLFKIEENLSIPCSDSIRSSQSIDRLFIDRISESMSAWWGDLFEETQTVRDAVVQQEVS